MTTTTPKLYRIYPRGNGAKARPQPLTSLIEFGPRA